MNWLAAAIGWLFGSTQAQSAPLAVVSGVPASIAKPPQPSALPPAQRKTSAQGVNTIKGHEGLRLQAYRDATGVWTIGYGHTATARAGLVWTASDAEMAFLRDVASAEQVVRRYVQAPLTQGQFDALVSFVFNLGPVKFASSTLLKLINGNQFARAAGEFGRWVYGTVSGRRVKLSGLEKRRADEAKLFIS